MFISVNERVCWLFDGARVHAWVHAGTADRYVVTGTGAVQEYFDIDEKIMRCSLSCKELGKTKSHG